MSKLGVSFTHIIKSGEPAFSILVSRFILGDSMYSRLWLRVALRTNLGNVESFQGWLFLKILNMVLLKGCEISRS
ncbi:putative sugar phosphate transporter domain-containing protein [Helianthus anomalus]